jgi:hypothetical protein
MHECLWTSRDPRARVHPPCRDTDADTNANADTNADTNTNAHADTNADTDADPDADPDGVLPTDRFGNLLRAW